MHLSAEQVPLYKLVIAVYIYLYNIIMYVVEYLCILCWFCIFVIRLFIFQITYLIVLFFQTLGTKVLKQEGYIMPHSF